MSNSQRQVTIEPNRIIVVDPDLNAEFEVWGLAPVQALGAVGGRELYFQANYDKWSFEIADEKGQFPSDGQANGGFYREAAYPNASHLELTQALMIIERGLREFLETHAS